MIPGGKGQQQVNLLKTGSHIEPQREGFQVSNWQLCDKAGPCSCLCDRLRKPSHLNGGSWPKSNWRLSILQERNGYSPDRVSGTNNNVNCIHTGPGLQRKLLLCLGLCPPPCSTHPVPRGGATPNPELKAPARSGVPGPSPSL